MNHDVDTGPTRRFVCASAALPDGRHLKLKLRFEGREEECLLLRFEGRCHAYINRCVHMPRQLVQACITRSPPPARCGGSA